MTRANKITAHNAGGSLRFRFAVGVFWTGVCEFLRSTTKTMLISLVALLVFQSAALAGIATDIPETNRVILPSGQWKPTAAETRKALMAIQSFLERPGSTNDWTKGEIKKIREHAKEYRVQFAGVLREGKQVIWCNFFRAPRNGENDGFPDWKRQAILVDDGGFWFWQIDYDPSEGKCLNFMSNADA